MEHTISKTVHHIAESYFVHSFKRRKKNSAGFLALKYIKTLPIPDSGKGGTINVLPEKGGGTFENTCMVMTEELHKHWGGWC